MFKVILHKDTENNDVYETQYLQYAKRHADLYKGDYPFIEILQCDGSGSEKVIETFGKNF